MTLPQISIIDIIKSERGQLSIKTENKSCYVLTCRTEGESLFFYHHQEHQVKRGDILYIPKNSSYAQKCTHETVVFFHLDIVGQVSTKMKKFSPEDREEICTLFLRAEELWKNKPQNFEFMCMAVLYEIISHIELCADEQTQSTADLLKPAEAYLNVHLYDADLALEKACAAAHISRTYFNKLFSRKYACTPTVYVNRQRIERAKQLLESGNFSNEEIALLCGFNDVKYFYVIFKKMTGLTTKAYKRSLENSAKSDS